MSSAIQERELMRRRSRSLYRWPITSSTKWSTPGWKLRWVDGSQAWVHAPSPDSHGFIRTFIGGAWIIAQLLQRAVKVDVLLCPGGDSAPRERNHHLQAVLQELELNIIVICDFQHHQALDTLEIVYLDGSSVLGGLILDGKIRDATFFLQVSSNEIEY